MLSATSRFYSAEKADANQLAQDRVYLVLGNYASASAFGTTASASGSDGSGNYPASGAIDGDRTELNVGAASGADNDVGLSSWRSAVAPSVTPQTLTLDFGQSRAINRIKLYHLSSHALKSYKLESSPDNVTYTLIAKTTDQGGTVATNSQVDTIDFTEVSCRYVKLTVADTVVAADMANVTEIEVYRKVDISSRVIMTKVNRARDYKLLNPLASTFQIILDNNDRFFSPSYVPTSAETTSGFVNSQLAPGNQIVIQKGFSYGGGTPEYVTVLNGSVDRLSVAPKDRTATLEGRDQMKTLINQIVSSKLKTAQDIKACMQYALNLANISNWEMSLDTTSLTIDFFFINNQSIMSVIRQLVEATADASFWFDESGIATFKDYVSATPNSHTDSSSADFNAGVLTNIDSSSTADQIGRKWFLIDDFADGEYFINPAWTSHVPLQSKQDTTQADFQAGTVKTNIDTNSTPGQICQKWYLIDDFADFDHTSNPTWTVVKGTWQESGGFTRSTTPGKIGQTFGGISVANLISDSMIQIASLQTSGTWRARARVINGAGTGESNFFFMHNGLINLTGSTTNFGHGTFLNGYFVKLIPGAFAALYKTDSSGAETLIAAANTTLLSNNTFYSIRVTRDTSGVMSLYVNEVIQNLNGPTVSNGSSVTDTSIISSSFYGFRGVDGASGGTNWATYDFDDLYYSYDQDGTGAISTSQPTFESQVFDQSANIVSEGAFTATVVKPSGCDLLFYTATSPDGISFDAYVAVTNGGQIQSTPRRYIKYKVVMVTPGINGTNDDFTTPNVQDVTINYTIVGWSVTGGKLLFAPSTSNTKQEIDTPLPQATGTFRASIQMTPGTSLGHTLRLYIVTTGYDISLRTYTSGYYAEANQNAGTLNIYKINSSGTRTLLATTAQAINTSAHSLRLTRDSSGNLNLYWDEVVKVTTVDTTYTQASVLGIEIDPNGDLNGTSTIDDIYWSPAIDGTGAISTAQATFESAAIDMGASVNSLGIFQGTTSTPTGTSLAFYTATSADNVTYDAYVAVAVNGAIASTVRRYLKWKVVMTCPNDTVAHGGMAANGNLLTPNVYDITINWLVNTGSAKYPTSVSYTFRYDGLLLDLIQEYTDNLGGDSSIINDVNVQATPLYLSGNNTDVQWQGTVQTPPVAISGSAPLAVTAGQVLTYAIQLSNGMDTSRMSGASPAAAAITAPAGTTWVFSTIHPTRPVLVITIGGTPGNITNLQLQGKVYTSSNAIAIQNSKDNASIRLYGDRQVSISNPYIVNTASAASVASKLVSNYKNPKLFIPSILVRPTWSAQINDRVTIVDYNTNINGDYIISGLVHTYQASLDAAVAQTELQLLKVS